MARISRRFELGKTSFGFDAPSANNAQRRLADADGGVVEQAFVDVTNLLDVETTKRKPLRFNINDLIYIDERVK